MIELIVMKHLAENLLVPVYMETPTTPPKRYVIIEKINGSEEDFINYAKISIESYAESLYESAKLNEEVKRTMKNIIASNKVSKCKLNGDGNFTDEAKKKYRYLATFDLVYLD